MAGKLECMHLAENPLSVHYACLWVSLPCILAVTCLYAQLITDQGHYKIFQFKG